METTLKTIGTDCWDIIINYKTAFEEYDEKMTKVTESLNSNIQKKHKVSLTMEEFMEFYIEGNHDFEIMFQVSVCGVTKPHIYYFNELNHKFLNHIKLFSIEYKHSSYDFDGLLSKMFILDFGFILREPLHIFQVVVLEALIQTKHQDNLYSRYIQDNFKNLYDSKHISTLYREYLEMGSWVGRRR